jgi:hypothetical protein
MCKKLAILVSLSIAAPMLVFIFFSHIPFGLCEKMNYGCITKYNILHNTYYVFALVLFFSIVAYRGTERVFTSWWKFARFAIPTAFLLSIPINLGLFHEPGGFMNMDDLTDFVLLGFVYVLFTIGSVIQIIRGYRQK